YLHMILWAFVPGLVTGFLQRLYYSIAYPVDSRSRPTKGDAKYHRHYRYIYTAVVLGYLAYTIAETRHQLPASHYAELNLTPSAFSSRDLKLNFKRLSLQAHPDKNDGRDTQFIRLRNAYETLNDPVRRFAYDRFGLEQAQCQACRTRHDYQASALPGILGYYIGTGVVMGLFALFGKGSFGSYWRWLFLCAMLVIDASLSVWSDSWLGALLSFIMPGLTPREQITVLHRVYISFFIAVNQIGPL
ncbi:DnaJ domain-containing protein, partial [Syncephalis pseudoplumigaleata]